jgi:16S rRNA (cytidine1402-2'-O)-methyltransferase
LFIVPTPLGNLTDVTLRSLGVLGRCDVIAAEDTRRTRKLLERHSIAARPVSLHRFNERGAAELVISMLEEGKDVAYVTDAGTPGVSDPGARLVARVRESDHRIVALPGACAAITALSASGWEGPFVFEGYPPRKAGARTVLMERIRRETRAVILYEAPGRLGTTLEELSRHVPRHEVLLAREMTKIHEQYEVDTAGGLLERLPPRVRGEITLVVMPPAGASVEEPDGEALERAAEAARQLALEGVGLKRACKALALATRLPSRRIYELAARGGRRR